MKLAISSGVLLVALAGLTDAQSQFGTSSGAPTKGAPKQSAGRPPARTVNGGSVLLGGNNDCATPMPIAGQGVFPFDNTAATTGTQGQNECDAIHNDVWWSWTADASGIVTITTCNQATFDTKLAAYPGGGCPVDGTSLACNDDACSLQSAISFNVTNGNTYLVQLGAFSTTGFGTGTITIGIAPPITNDDCSSPDVLIGQGVFPYSNLGATTGTEGQNEALCFAFGTSGIDNDVWFAWTADADGIALINSCGSAADTRVAAYPGNACPLDGTSLACNDDSCGLQSSIAFTVQNGATYMLQAGNYPGSSSSGANQLDISIVDPPEGYAYDLGTSEDALGLTNGGGMGWLHGFDAENGADSISEVSATYGTPAFPGTTPNLPGTVAVWDDPTDDFDPTDAVLLYSAPITAANEDTDIFNPYAIPDVPVTGVFFIGIVLDQPAGDFVASMDFDIPSSGRAWVVGNTNSGGGFGSFDYNNLAANDVPPAEMGSIGFSAVFLLRGKGSDGIGTKYCTANSNSTGAPADLAASGSTSSSAGDLTLTSTPVPNQPGIFFHGANQAQLPFGNGFLCASGDIVRGAVVFAAGNGASYTYDNSNAKHSLSGYVGVTRNFQHWFRDPMGGGQLFNTSNGLAISITP